MKALGIVTVVIAGFTAGALKRSRMTQGERATSLLAELFTDIKYTLIYSSGSLVDSVERLSLCERYASLTFLTEAISRARTMNLGEALASAFCEWEGCALLSNDDRDSALDVLSRLGSDSIDREKQKLDGLCERLNASAERRAEDNRKKRGYYETLFTLAGAAAALVLM